MSKAKELIEQLNEQEEVEAGPGDLKDVMNEFNYGLASELDHNAGNLSTGPDATTMLEISSDKGPNWIELILWDKNRFDTPIGSVRYICGMKAQGDGVVVSTGKGIEKIKFNTKDEEIEKIPDIQDKEEYKDKINRIRRIFLGFQLNVVGITGIPNDPNSFESIGKRVGRGLVDKCSQYLK